MSKLSTSKTENDLRLDAIPHSIGNNSSHVTEFSSEATQQICHVYPGQLGVCLGCTMRSRGHRNAQKYHSDSL